MCLCNSLFAQSSREPKNYHNFEGVLSENGILFLWYKNICDSF